MSLTLLKATILAVALVLLCGGNVSAQETTPPQFCNTTTGLLLNNTALGNLYVIQRNPIPASSIGCAAINLLNINATGANASYTASHTSSQWYNNQTWQIQLTFGADNKTATFVDLNNVNQTLKFVYSEAAFTLACTYWNASDMSDSKGYVLSANRSQTFNNLPSYDTQTKLFSNFANQSQLANITQTKDCITKSGASGVVTMPFMTAIFALIYAVLNFAN